MATALFEHVAPGEEQVVFSRTAGVVASKISYMEILDPANDWQMLESPVRLASIPCSNYTSHRRDDIEHSKML